MLRIIFAFALILCSFGPLDAQYFGRNKPRYRSFDFKVAESQHFKTMHYLNNKQVLNDLVSTSETWYDNHKKIWGKDILFKNPVIFYNNHAEFQQTNAIGGEIGVGTGGVTEALKNRVIMPITFSLASTHHVLAHELVHAFQFNAIQTSGTTGLQSLGNMPLWLIEGQAEYLSIGRKDPFTAMWMRDAILNNTLPEISKMNDPKYFPYRYGHALMAFLGGMYGDNTMEPLFMNTGMYGVELGLMEVYRQDAKNISNMWHSALKTHYGSVLNGRKERPQGKKLISEDNAGRMNLTPALSPNGKYVVFLSEKDLFNTDLYLADAAKGKILNKVTSLSQAGDLDYINVMESSGAWAPNGRDFAFVGISKGRNVLVIKDADAGRTINTLRVKNLDAFVNPCYHPDGKRILVTGLKEGQPDLYIIDIKTEEATQITDDLYSENMAVFSNDGTKIVFCYDRKSIDNNKPQGKYTYDLAEMDFATKSIRTYDIFHGANNLNPVFDHEDNVYFVSDRDGMRNMYRLNRSTSQVFQMTDLLTGISGISGFTPMISASNKRDRVLYTHYYNSSYAIYEAQSTELLNKLIEDTKTVDQTLGTLPVFGLGANDYVGQSFGEGANTLASSSATYKEEKYKPNFKLDYIGGGTGIGLGVGNNNFGSQAGLQGGIDMLFGDNLGNHQLFSQVALNGDFLDMGGIVNYINRNNRLAWGIGLSHVPLRTGSQSYSQERVTIDGLGERDVLKESLSLIRIFDQNLNLFAHYPLSTTFRLEGGIAGSARSFRWDEYQNYYLPVTQSGQDGYQQVGSERERIETGDELQIDQYYTIVKGLGANANAAIVGDNSYFGMTSPLVGHRFRLGVEKYLGNGDNYWAFLGDGRKYWRMAPFTFAVRGMSYLRFIDESKTVYPFYIGNMGFVRGLGSVISNKVDELGLTFGQLIGSKMMLGNAEIRVPFTGPRKLAVIPSRFLFTDLNLFFDTGVAFDDFSEFSDGRERDVVRRDDNGNIVLDANGAPITDIQTIKPTFVSSLGVSMRVNLFGALILEPYFAKPLTQGSRINFGLNIVPGW
jgi:Tol biopolymer transport system component